MIQRDFSIGETHKGEWDVNSSLEVRGLDYLRGFLGSCLRGLERVPEHTAGEKLCEVQILSSLVLCLLIPDVCCYITCQYKCDSDP